MERDDMYGPVNPVSTCGCAGQLSTINVFLRFWARNI